MAEGRVSAQAEMSLVGMVELGHDQGGFSLG